MPFEKKKNPKLQAASRRRWQPAAEREQRINGAARTLASSLLSHALTPRLTCFAEPRIDENETTGERNLPDRKRMRVIDIEDACASDAQLHAYLEELASVLDE